MAEIRSHIMEPLELSIARLAMVRRDAIRFVSIVVYAWAALIQIGFVSLSVRSHLHDACLLGSLALWVFVFCGVRKRRSASAWLLTVGLLTIGLIFILDTGLPRAINWVKNGARIYGFPLIKLFSEYWTYLLLVMLMMLLGFFLVVWAVQLWKTIKCSGQQTGKRNIAI